MNRENKEGRLKQQCSKLQALKDCVREAKRKECRKEKFIDCVVVPKYQIYFLIYTRWPEQSEEL